MSSCPDTQDETAFAAVVKFVVTSDEIGSVWARVIGEVCFLPGPYFTFLLWNVAFSRTFVNFWRFGPFFELVWNCDGMLMVTFMVTADDIGSVGERVI